MNFDTIEPKPEPNHPFFGYDLITDLVNTTKCPVLGCTNKKKKEQGICDECWSRVPESEKTVEGMFKGSMLGKLVSGMTEQIRKNHQIEPKYPPLRHDLITDLENTTKCPAWQSRNWLRQNQQIKRHPGGKP